MLRALIAGAEFAGHLSGQQIGFNYGATIDPQSGVRNNMLATLYGIARHARRSSRSTATTRCCGRWPRRTPALPIGIGAPERVARRRRVRDIFALVFVVGARLAAPIVVVLLIVELAVGLISRASPALSFMVIGYPIRIIVGLIAAGGADRHHSGGDRTRCSRRC